MYKKVIEQFQLDVLFMEEVDDSHSSTVFQCHLKKAESVFIKIPYTTVKYKRELEAYKILEGHVPIPKLLNYWPGDGKIPGAFLLSQLKGEPLHGNVTAKVAYEVGILHASLHNVKPPVNKQLTGIQNKYSTWQQFITEQFYNFAVDVKEVINEQMYNKAIAKFEKMKKQLPDPDGPSFVHMDFRPANIIIHDEGVSGVIDFESVRFGSTEVDFTKLHRDFLQYDDTLYEAYQSGYQSVRPLIDLEVVLPFYQFTDAFNSIGWCKRRGLEENARFLKQNLTLLEKYV